MLVKRYYGSQSLKLPQIGHLLNHTHGNVTMHVCMYVYTNTDTGSSCFPSIAWANLPAAVQHTHPMGITMGKVNFPAISLSSTHRMQTRVAGSSGMSLTASQVPCLYLPA